MALIKTLIVGANSFLATSLARAFSHDTRYVVGLVHHSDNLVDHLKYKKIYKDLDKLFAEQSSFDQIFIIGAYIPYGSFERADQRYVSSNIELSIKISKQYPLGRIVFCSSISVYGQPVFPILKEDSPFNNPGLYGFSKIAGEAVIKNHSSYAIIRFSSIWGAGMQDSTYIPRLIKQAKTGKIAIWGIGSRLQNYIHVDDASQICIAAAEKNENFTVLGVYPKSYSNLEVAKLTAKETNSAIVFEKEDNSPDFVFDATMSYKTLDYRPNIGIEDRINELL